MKTHSNLALVEGEVYVLSDEKIKVGDLYFNGHPHAEYNICKAEENSGVLHFQETGYTGCNTILASTAKLEGIPQLERKWFVKPVDVEELAEKYAYKNEQSYEYHMNDSGVGYVKQAYIDCHNANKAEFTRDEMEQAIKNAVQEYYKFTEVNIDSVIDSLRPLSLPKSITLNDDNEIISVEWN